VSAGPKRPAPDGFAGVGAAVLDALPISLYVVDRRLRIVFWNRERESGAHGRPRAEVLGRSLSHALAPAGYRATAPLIRRVFATGRSQEETRETQGARLFHVRRLPVRQGRHVTHVLSLFEDVTKQRALEMHVIASDRLAFLGQLVAGVAHEIANPLAGIAGCAEALASLALRAPGEAAQREAREFRDLVRSEVARSERLVRTLLESARPASGRAADVAGTVAAVMRLLERHPAFRRVKVVSRPDPRLPEAAIEPDSLRQVVLALAVNAARAMAGGGTLTLRAAADRQGLRLDVLDTGPGVPAELRGRVFQPYFTTDRASGTGLGLAIARSLVRARGGDLVYRARPRGGACFRVTLPVATGAR
jgi:two-component system, NtrC family, sensor kinase